jgi:phosphatidylglycerol:prolipoprotein diacylglycerol transferase
MIHIDWNPAPLIGPIPVNWYGLAFALAFLVAGLLVRRWAPGFGVSKENVESLLVWILVGTIAGARLYYIVQNDFTDFLRHPWRIVAVWEGGLAFFGGLGGGIAAAYLYARRQRLPFFRMADLFAPAIPIGGAIGRISCGLDGMDYGTPTSLPWGVVYENPNSFAPLDGLSRHPAQFYELLGDVAIAGILLRLRGRMPEGATFFLYLGLFSALRFFVFFTRGNVPEILFGLKNAQWTALVILLAVFPVLIRMISNTRDRNGIPPA